MTLIKNIDTMFREALDIMEELHIEVGNITDVSWNGRLKAVWGRCYYNTRTETYRIELNPVLRLPEVSWEDAMNTMIHEVLHAYTGRMKHTGEWKRCAEIVNREYPLYNITRCTSAEEKGVADKMNRYYKYIVTCDVCGTVCKYKRAGNVVKALKRNPHSCKCTLCGGESFTVIEN